MVQYAKGVYVSKHGKNLVFHEEITDDYSRRVQSIIQDADSKHDFPEFNCIFVSTDESRLDAHAYATIKLGSIGTNEDVLTCPDWMFDTGYDDVCRNIASCSKSIPETDRIVCCRNCQTLTTYPLLDFHEDCHDIAHLARRYRYFLDTDDGAHRLKLMLFGRIVFVTHREKKEYYHRDLKPWIHYVPVLEDLSDLKTNLERLKCDPDLEKSILKDARDFASKNLTRDAAIDRWNFLIHEVVKLQQGMEKPIVALAMYTENYRELYRKWISTLPRGFEPVVTYLETADRWTDFGFQKTSWYDLIRIKVEKSADYLTTQPDGVIVLCSDSDIMFMKSTDELYRLAVHEFSTYPDLDMWIMEETTSGVCNGGFYFVKNSKKVREFVRRMANSCYKKTPLADQDFLNANVKSCLNHRFIPMQYIICGTDIFDPERSLFYHAVEAFNTHEKLIQQEKVMDALRRGEKVVEDRKVTFHMRRRIR